MKTILETIREHQDAIHRSEDLVREQAENDQRLKESYQAIRNVLLRDDMKGKALVDRCGHVYFLRDGLVMNMPAAWTDELELGQDNSLDDQQDIVSVGEAS